MSRSRSAELTSTPTRRIRSPCLRECREPPGRRAAEKAGLVGGEGFAVDASLIVADANKKQRSIPGAEGNKERAAKDAAELATL